MTRKPKGSRLRLTAKFYRVAMVRWVDIPRDKVASLGASRNIDALLRFNDDTDRVTLLPRGRDCYKLAFKVELLRAAGVDAGDTISFTLEPDTDSREPELPAEMHRAFATNAELAERWAVHSVAIRRQVVRYIFQAKTPETQPRRSRIFLERLADDGSLSKGIWQNQFSDYRSCIAAHKNQPLQTSLPTQPAVPRQSCQT